MNETTRAALGELAGYNYAMSSEPDIERAHALNPAAFEQLVERARQTASPAGYIVVGARRITQESDQVSELQAQNGSAKAEKRVRSALNYSRTALGLVHVEQQEEDLREVFPWISGTLLTECLNLGRRANQAHLDDEAQLLREATKRRNIGA